jgi:hypothetical protein
MPKLTLNQAAKEAGKAKKTILEAIRAGKLSAPKDDEGHYQIDPAELFRVWPPTTTEPVTETATHPTPPETETTLLRQKSELLERENRLLGQALEDLREDRDHWRRQATHLLTNRPQADTTSQVRPAFWIALAVILACIAAVLWPSKPASNTLPITPQATKPEPRKPIPKPDGEPWHPDDGG